MTKKQMKKQEVIELFNKVVNGFANYKSNISIPEISGKVFELYSLTQLILKLKKNLILN